MPRYFLHLIDGDTKVKDLEGEIYQDGAAARLGAITAAREILADQLMSGEALDGQRIEIETEAGELVGVIRLADEIRLADGHP